MQKRHGFSMVEMIAALGILSALSGAIIPLVGKQMESAMASRAVGETHDISSAMTSFIADTDRTPTNNDDDDQKPLLSVQRDANETGVGLMKDHFIENTYNYIHWKGPYISQELRDPWNQPYIVTTEGFCPEQEGVDEAYVWVVSGGVDKALSTSFTTVPSSYDPDHPKRKAGSPAVTDLGVLNMTNYASTAEWNCVDDD